MEYYRPNAEWCVLRTSIQKVVIVETLLQGQLGDGSRIFTSSCDDVFWISFFLRDCERESDSSVYQCRLFLSAYEVKNDSCLFERPFKGGEP